MTTPILLKWFVNRDVPTCAPSSDGMLIPILSCEFLLLFYLHSRKFINSMDGAKSGVLIRAGCHIQLLDIIWRSASIRNALFCFVPIHHFHLIKSMGICHI